MTDKFIRQSRRFSEQLNTKQLPHECLHLSGANHYSVARMLGNTASSLFQKIASLNDDSNLRNNSA
ncbi:hypothetical protein [Algicola sagamiensis]|uniref:hypothetical protein n=1 Tax=Algicola sagamiensis TaxID=163869 RepID=UPI00036DB76F|nr:hypothetical protein [Algicola sagamiensis]